MAAYFDIVPADEDDIPALSALAEEIWFSHFPAIIGEEGCRYMVDTYQSAEAMREQMREEGYNYRFFVSRESGEPEGYFAFYLRPEKSDIYLSKLYMRKDQRGRGCARQALDYLADIARAEGLDAIRLTCNSGNTGSIAVYEHLGFVLEDRIVDNDVGGGYIMDDSFFAYDVDSALA